LPSPIEAGQNPNGKRAEEDDGARPFQEGGGFIENFAPGVALVRPFIGRKFADEGGFFLFLPKMFGNQGRDER
jgi:hypothetical protein